MRRRNKIIIGILVVFVISYEAAFRICTSKWGEVDTRANPPRVYYSEDFGLPFPLFRWCFGFRTELPFGKVRLAKGSGAYVNGGRFYRHLADGSWQDFTKQLIEYQNRKIVDLGIVEVSDGKPSNHGIDDGLVCIIKPTVLTNGRVRITVTIGGTNASAEDRVSSREVDSLPDKTVDIFIEIQSRLISVNFIPHIKK